MVNIKPQDVFDHLGYDITDEMIERKINHLITVADSYLKGAIGEGYPDDDPRAKELALTVIADLYDQRAYTSEKVSNQVRQLVNDFSLQLRLELVRSKGGD